MKNREGENLLIEKIEQEMELPSGDFSHAVDGMYFTLKFLLEIGHPKINIYGFGSFNPSFANVTMSLKKNLRRYFHLRRNIYMPDRDEKLDIVKGEIRKLIITRRRLIDLGLASKTYYLKKGIVNGKVDREAAKVALKILQDRLQGLSKTRP